MNMPYESRSRIAAAFAIALSLTAGGCNEQRGQTELAGSAAEEALTAASAPGPESSPVEIDLSKGWCGGHGVPESVCTRCDSSLIPQFKAANDWCSGHELPETQCIQCNPEVKAKWEALQTRNDAAPEQTEDGDDRAAIRLERVRRLLSGSNDPQCQVDLLRIRFLDGTIAEKAGIRTDTVRMRRLSSAIECFAEVDFDQTRLARVAPRVSGVVRTATVAIGAVVRVGDVLAVIDSPALGHAKSRYIRVRENHLLAGTDYERVRAIYEGVQRMLAVCTASASAEEVGRKLLAVRVGEAKGRLLRAHSAFELARATFEREASLRERGISTELAYETARSSLASTEADFRATHEAIAFASEGDRLAAERDLKVAKSDFEAVERELQILGVSDEQLAELGTAPVAALSRYELRSPVAGRVVERRAVVGESAEERDALYSVADLSTMWLMMDVYQRDLMQVRPGLPVLFTVDGLPGHSFEGRIAWVSSMVDDRTRTAKVRADLPNERGLLRANMFGLARIIVHDDAEVLSVPVEAVQTDGCCQLVFVRSENVLFEPRKVTLGASAGGYVEILAGLASGEEIVTTGSYLMKTEILKSNIGAGCCEVDPGR
ncbi:MAG: efflux RND transporter periplasmic adaptor subunit [Planctomycetes bacterium]|nr:efflux RND transporter periplasmic adaptor subunit [Planctomycetota bacterium]